MKNLLILISALLLFLQCSSEPYEFSDESTSEILQTLSSDEMRGRQAFTPDIDKAADYIADQFDNAGLEYLDGDSDFLQEFKVYSVQTKEADIEVNGRKIAKNDFFGILDTADISWTKNNDIATEHIAEEEDFRQRFNELRNSTSETFVFVDKNHEDIFRRYQPFFTRAGRFFPDEQPANVIFVLTSESPQSDFSVNVAKDFSSITLANVAGIIEGKRTDEFVLFSAHYDHIGIRTPQEAGADSIANGANDNASGVTAVIELAKYFASESKPERTLLFVAFTAEEAGGYGSQYFSKQQNPDQIMAMFNIEMIGKPAKDGPNSAWITGFDKSSFGELLQKSAEGTIYEFYPDPYPTQNLFYRSDNATLARQGVPAHTISTTPIDVDPDYHRVSDEFETINISHVTNTIRAISKAATGIVSGRDTPTRVDESQLN